MVAGLSDKKVVFIVQARMSSTRLPGKILMPIPIPNGQPLIKWILESLSESSSHAEVIVATSQSPENDIFFNYCKAQNIKCFRGSEDDVLSRFIKVLKSDRYDVAVRLTGDNPLIDIKILDEAIDFHLACGNDYTNTTRLPLGMNFEICSPAALLDLESQPVSEHDKEHVTAYIKRNSKYKKSEYAIADESLKALRLTVDYPSDFLVVSAVLSLAMTTSLKGMDLVRDAMRKYPWLFEVNAGNIQK